MRNRLVAGGQRGALTCNQTQYQTHGRHSCCRSQIADARRFPPPPHSHTRRRRLPFTITRFAFHVLLYLVVLLFWVSGLRLSLSIRLA